MATSPKLGLPLLNSGGLGEEDFVNTAINFIDPGFMGAAESKTNTPPGSPSQGALYLVGPTPIGAWAAQDEDTIAVWYGAWYFITPYEGCFVYRKDLAAPFVFSTDYANPTFASLIPIWSTTQYPVIGRRSGNGMYSKVIDVGALPNATTKTVAHNITGLNLTTAVTFHGSAEDGTDRYPLPLAKPGTGQIGVWLDSTNLNVHSTFNASAWTGEVLCVYALTP